MGAPEESKADGHGTSDNQSSCSVFVLTSHEHVSTAIYSGWHLQRLSAMFFCVRKLCVSGMGNRSGAMPIFSERSRQSHVLLAAQFPFLCCLARSLDIYSRTLERDSG